MSCKQCTTKFNFFHKEVGCANCGLSFCNKCLKQKSKVPTKGSGDYQVCKGCYIKLQNASSSTTANPTVITPPEAFLRRLEALENPLSNPITIYPNAKANNLQSTATRSATLPSDAQLRNRLEKLKDTGKGSPPSETELRQRLATLKGTNNYVEGPSKQSLFYNARDTRTEREKADALLEQFLIERDIELAHNPQEEIEIRLACLREQGTRPNEGPFLKNLHDSTSSSEDEVEKVTRKIMDEVALESKDEQEELGTKNQLEEKWCVVCNKEAKVRCPDCDGDLYCASCNKIIHDDWDRTHYKNMQDVN